MDLIRSIEKEAKSYERFIKRKTTYIAPSNGHRRCNVCFAEVQKRARAKTFKSVIKSNS